MSSVLVCLQESEEELYIWPKTFQSSFQSLLLIFFVKVSMQERVFEVINCSILCTHAGVYVKKCTADYEKRTGVDTLGF